MHNALRMSRRTFTVAVVVATIAWSIGLAALITPLTASAASSGDLVRGSLPAVYYVGSDAKRYVFPNKKTFDTWYSDFSGVTTITDAELAALPIGGNATYKPGVRMIKIQTDPKTYAVDQGGVLRWVKDEATAVALYGSAWNTMIDDVPDAFFTNYSIGADVNSGADFNVANVTAGSPDINTDKGLAASVEGLSVSLSAGQPAGGTLPLGAMGVNVLKVDVHNSGSVGLTVDSVTLRRTGAGNATDWASVYVYSGNDRLTTGRTINATSHEVTVGGLNLDVPAAGMAPIWFAGDVAAGGLAGNVHMFELVGLTSGATSASGTPLMGSTFTLSAAAAGNVAIAPTGTLGNVKAGETSAKLGQFQLTANVENQDLTKVVLSYNGTVTRDNLSNFVLKQNGVTVASAASINSKDQLVFVLSPAYNMERGNVRTFELYGDVSGSSRAAQTVNFYLDQNADLLAIGLTYGYGVRISANTYTSGAAGATATVEAGKLNITYNGPSASNIAPRAQDVEIFNFTTSPQSNLEVRTITFNLAFTGGAAAADFSDLKLVDTATGSIVAGPYTPVAGANAMTEVINLNSGVARTFKLTVDVESTLLANEIITATLNAFGATHVRNLDNSTYLTVATDIVPAGAIVGNAHTGQIPSLTVTAASVPVAQTYIKGSSGVSLAGIGLTAGDAMDIKVTQVVLTGFIDTNDATATCTVAADATLAQGSENTACDSVASTVLTAKLMNGSTQVGSTKSPSASAAAGAGGVLTFDNLNITVLAGQTVGLELNGNLAAGLTAANLPYTLRFDVAAASVTATDPDGNTVGQTGTTTGPLMAVANSGSLLIEGAPSDTDTEAGLVVGGSSNTVLAKYKFTAQNEELKVTKVGFTIAVANTVTSVSLYDGSTLVGGPKGITGGGVVNFTGLDFVVPKDSSKVLTVKANLNSVGASGATTGTAATATLAATAGTFEARGTSSGSSTVLTDANDFDGAGTPDLRSGSANAMNAIAGNAKIVRKSKPVVALVSLPSSVLIPGTVVGLRFSVSADAAGDVSLRGLVTQIVNGTAASTVTADATSSIRVVGDSSNIAGAALIAPACTTGVTCELVSEFTNEYVISAGTTKTFDVRLANSAAATGDSLTSSLLGDATLLTGVLSAGTPATKLTVAGTAANFVWSDMSIIPHSDALAGASSADFANGMYVKIVPTDSQTMSK